MQTYLATGVIDSRHSWVTAFAYLNRSGTKNAGSICGRSDPSWGLTDVSGTGSPLLVFSASFFHRWKMAFSQEFPSMSLSASSVRCTEPCTPFTSCCGFPASAWKSPLLIVLLLCVSLVLCRFGVRPSVFVNYFTLNSPYTAKVPTSERWGTAPACISFDCQYFVPQSDLSLCAVDNRRRKRELLSR